MKTLIRSAAVCLIIPAIAACDTAPTALVPAGELVGPSAVEGVADTRLDPVARQVFRFMIDTPELIDNPDLIDNPNLRPWAGSIVDANGEEAGGIRIEWLLPAVKRGETLRLSQVWSFDGDGNLPAVQLDGVLNLSAGQLVLNGRQADGGTVHVRGQVLVSDGGSSIFGELMFNPQPDPPMPIP